MKNRISMALKDPILQQGFEIICKENAELRKFREFLAVGSKLNKGLISRNKFLEEECDKYLNMVFDQMKQLDKAKEIIYRLMDIIKHDLKCFDTMAGLDIKQKAEQFLKDSEVKK
jgi:hypothetical protein